MRVLETNLPPIDGDVKIVFEDLETELAYTIHNGKDFEIHIDNRLCFYCKRDTLIHEWAHALDWWNGGNESDHGPSWGLQYGRCYECVLKARYRE